MAEMKSKQEQSNQLAEKENELKNNGEVQDNGSSSMDDDSIVTPAAVAAATANQVDMIKKSLSKQPSNGINVLKPDSLSPTTNGLPPFPNPSAQNGDLASKHSKDDISFDPNGSYYMANACCELIHYRTAAILIGIIELVMIGVWAYFISRFSISSIDTIGSKASVGTQATIAAVFSIIIILMLVGVISERAILLWPHMIVQILGIALGIAFTIVAVIAMCAGTSLAEAIFSHIYGPDNLPIVEAALGPIWPFCLAVVFDFGAALGIWFYIVIKGCYEYLMDKAFFEQQFTNGVLSMKKENLDVTNQKS